MRLGFAQEQTNRALPGVLSRQEDRDPAAAHRPRGPPLHNRERRGRQAGAAVAGRGSRRVHCHQQFA
eukprot:15440078-Alexandrium_andersonii.AAC.1